MDHKHTVLTSYMVGGFISLVASIALVIAHAFSSKLHKSPWDIILGCCFWQVYIDFHLVYSWMYDMCMGTQAEDDGCKSIAFLSIYTFFTLMNYLLALSFEVFQSARKPLFRNYKSRGIAYHTVSNTSALVLAIIAAAWDWLGVSQLHTCSIKAYNWFQLVLIVPWVLHFPISMVLWIMALKIVSRKTETLRYTIFIFLVYMLILPSCLAEVSRYFTWNPALGYFEIYGAVTLSITGLVVSVYRFVESWYWEPLRIFSRSETNSTLGIPLNETGPSLFESIFLDGVINSLLALSMVFEKNRKISMVKVNDIYAEQVKYHFPRSEVRLRSKQLSQNIFDYETPNYSYRVIEYAPQAFDNIRKLDAISRETILESINPSKNLDHLFKNAAANGGGRSGSFFFFSYDKRFILKSISDDERKVMIEKLLEDYVDFVTYLNVNSILSRVYGVYTIRVGKTEDLCLQIMGNIVPNPTKTNVLAMFDIKGSIKDRMVAKEGLDKESIQSGAVYKDIDFENAFGQIEVMGFGELKQAIEADVDMLECHNIMDYSLLICVIPKSEFLPKSNFVFKGTEYNYVMGIIDFLQLYNLQKKLETISKSVNRDQKEVSSINSKEYKVRFLKRIQSYII